MNKLSVIFVIICSSLLISACSDKASKDAASQKSIKSEKSVHAESAGQAAAGGSGLSEMVKKQTLPEFPSMPIGKALNGYSHFTQQEWKDTQTDSNKFYIDYTGWLDTKKSDVASIKNGISRVGIAIKFVVLSDGSFGLAMISKLEATTDGNVHSYPLEDAKGVLGKIYANKEIDF